MLFAMENTSMEMDMSHSKIIKRTRRGKKRHPYRDWQDDPGLLRDSTCGCGSEENLEEQYSFDDLHSKAQSRRKSRMLRPLTSPKAPYNSNQFLIEDRLNSEFMFDLDQFDKIPTQSDEPGTSSLYINMARVPMLLNNDQCLSPDPSWSTEFSDIDYQYRQFADADLEFLKKDFEEVFLSEKESQLNGMSKQELIKEVKVLQYAVRSLKDDLPQFKSSAEDQNRHQNSPNNLLDSHQIADQQYLLDQLRAENHRLREENSELKIGMVYDQK